MAFPIDGPFLAYDCSLGHGSAVVGVDGGMLAEERLLEGADIGMQLLPLIDRVVSKAAIRAADLRGVITTLGPGSFTGTRAGLAAAQGLRTALSIPVLAVSSFEALLSSFRPPTYPSKIDRIGVLLLSHQDWVYHQVFSLLKKPITAPRMARISEVLETESMERTLFIGTASAAFEKAGCLIDRPPQFVEHHVKIYARYLVDYADRLSQTPLEARLEPLQLARPAQPQQ